MPNSEEACPRCGSPRIVLGELTRGRTNGATDAFGFRAFASRFTSIRTGTEMSPAVSACAHCGMVWGQVSVTKLQRHLEKLPSAEITKWLPTESDLPS